MRETAEELERLKQKTLGEITLPELAFCLKHSETTANQKAILLGAWEEFHKAKVAASPSLPKPEPAKQAPTGNAFVTLMVRLAICAILSLGSYT